MTEEEKAIKWLEKNTKNYNLSGEELHYSLILFYLIINLQQKNKKYKETIDKAIEYLKKWGIEPDADMYWRINEYKEYRELLAILKEVG